MGQRRLAPAELTDDELLALVAGADASAMIPAKSANEHEEVLNFLALYDVRLGENKVRLDALYKVYAVGTKAPISLITFTKIVCLAYDHERGNNATFLYLNHDFAAVHRLIHASRKDSGTKKRSVVSFSFNKKQVEKFFDDAGMIVGQDKAWAELAYMYAEYVEWYWKNYKEKNSLFNKKAFKEACQTYFKTKQVQRRNQHWFMVARDAAERIQGRTDVGAGKEEDEREEV